MDSNSRTRDALMGVFRQPLGDAVTSVVEYGVDTLIDSPELIEAIPGVSVLLKGSKGVLSLPDALFATRMSQFLNALRDNSVDPTKLNTFAADLDRQPQKLKRFAKTTLYQIAVQNDDSKAILLAEVLKSHVKGNIDNETYEALAYAITAVHPNGFQMVANLVSNPEAGTRLNYGATLVGTGLAAYSTGAIVGNDGRAFLTPLGRALYDHGISNRPDLFS